MLLLLADGPRAVRQTLCRDRDRDRDLPAAVIDAVIAHPEAAGPRAAPSPAIRTPASAGRASWDSWDSWDSWNFWMTRPWPMPPPGNPALYPALMEELVSATI